MTTTLTEFLLARIAEDEAAARAALGPPAYSHYGDNAAEETVAMGQGEGCAEEGADHLYRWLPPRVLAECDAKRRITSMHVEREYECSRCDTGYWDENDDGAEVYGARPEAYPCETLRALALPYADHPDYLPEWRL